MKQVMLSGPEATESTTNLLQTLTSVSGEYQTSDGETKEAMWTCGKEEAESPLTNKFEG